MSTQSTDSAIDGLAAAAWDRVLERSPHLRVRQGLPVEWIPSGSPAELEDDASFARTQLERLEGAGRASESDQAKITAGVLRHLYAEQVEAVDAYWHAFAVTPYMSTLLAVTPCVDYVFTPFQFRAPADGERYLKLLHDFGELIRQMDRRTREQDQRGIRVPRRAIDAATATMANHRARVDAGVRVNPERLPADTKAISERADKIIDDDVLPAFDSILEFLRSDYRDRLPDAVGLSQYPDGEDAYRRLVRQHATLDVTPEQVHQTGLDEVAAITERMSEVRGRIGFSGAESEFHASLKERPSLFAKSPEEVEQRYVDYMDRLEPHLLSNFRVLPKAKYGVARLDPGLEAGLTYGYYEPPTPEQPVGRYRYNASNLEGRSLLTAAAIIYHELAPGHHFHIARQSENESLPPIRREGYAFSAYTEGWAEYASNLAVEMGLFDDYELYGRLVHERFTAQRLVIDTGMNLLGWPLDKAVDYMRANTLESDTQIASETLRYATDLPGQALAYRTGFLKLSELRDRMRRAQGSSFDIRDYHELVLGNGAMPLSLLEQHVEDQLRSIPV